jgi:hypothetical protein
LGARKSRLREPTLVGDEVTVPGGGDVWRGWQSREDGRPQSYIKYYSKTARMRRTPAEELCSF